MEEIRVPQINANEEEVEVVEVPVEQGDFVEAGDVLCTLESTKATLDLEAPVQGYVRRLAVEVGTRVVVGELICALTESEDEPVESMDEAPTAVGDEVRTTRRATSLIDEYDLDAQAIDHGGIITERDVLEHLGERDQDLRAPTDVPGQSPVRVRDTNGDAIVIYGAGGHARVVIEMIREARRDLHVIGIVDDAEKRPAEVFGVPVVGDADRLEEFRNRGVQLAALGVGAVTHNALRAELFDRLTQQGFGLPNLIHPDATVEQSVRMGRGNQIFAGAVVSSNVELGDNTIVNANAVVSHDCRIADHAHLTPGALLAGGVSVGPKSVIGMGVTVYLGIEIGTEVVVPNGNDVFENIPKSAQPTGRRSSKSNGGQPGQRYGTKGLDGGTS